MKKSLLYFAVLICVTCSCYNKVGTNDSSPFPSFEKISFFKYPVSAGNRPFKYRLTYYFDNGKPHRWMELDSSGRITTDYIYEYDTSWVHTGARYKEDAAIDFSIEKVRFENDSTRITEWIDSSGQVYYRMIDNLNKNNKTYRAAFIGDELHGFDSTFYTEEGFEQRIFFTSTSGKVYNDRRFLYDSINGKGDWLVRKKIMQDEIAEVQVRDMNYDNAFVSENGKFYEGVVSTAELSENVVSFSKDNSVMLVTRTNNWTEQAAYISYKINGLFTETVPIRELEKIYNGALSPMGDKIVYCTRTQNQYNIWLINKENGRWGNRLSLTEQSSIRGGYFNWFSDSEIYFYQDRNNGDIVLGEISKDGLNVTDSLSALNTMEATEFSPFVDRQRRFIIFSRYEEGNIANQGFFVSYNHGDFEIPEWTKPKKIDKLPYGWGSYIINNGTQFIYTDGEDIYSMQVENLELDIDS